jgi:hypothetical protein
MSAVHRAIGDRIDGVRPQPLDRGQLAIDARSLDFQVEALFVRYRGTAVSFADLSSRVSLLIGAAVADRSPEEAGEILAGTLALRFFREFSAAPAPVRGPSR